MKKKYVIIIAFNLALVAGAAVAYFLWERNAEVPQTGAIAGTGTGTAARRPEPATPSPSAAAFRKDVLTVLRRQKIDRDPKNPNRAADRRKTEEIENGLLEAVRSDPAPAIDLILHDSDAQARRYTFSLVERAKRVSDMKPLLSNFKNADNELKGILLVAAAKMGGPEETVFLTSNLKSEKDQALRRRFLQAVSMLPPATAYPVLKETASSDSDPAMRGLAVSFLARIDTGESLEFLKGLASSNAEAALRTRAVTSVVELEGEKSLEFLSGLLKAEKDGAVRHAILGHLVKIGYKANMTEAVLGILREYADFETDPASKKDAENRIIELMRKTNRPRE